MSVLVLKALQQALYTKLSGDSLLLDMVEGVFDTVPEGTALPYLMIGEAAQEALPDAGGGKTRCALLMHVWTAADGRKTALGIMERLYALLHHGSMSVTGHPLVAIRCMRASVDLAEQAQRLHGEMEFELLVEG